MLGRRLLALVAGLTTVVLLVLLTGVVRSVWFELVLTAWWLALIVHAVLLARRGRTRLNPWPRQRLTAFAVAIPVFLVVGLLRLDAAGIDHAVSKARNDGNCPQATAAVSRVWLGHRVADAPLVASVERTADACRRLGAASAALTGGLAGNTALLQQGFDTLGAVLAQLPGHERMVDATLDQFLHSLPTTPCDTVDVTDWLRQRPPTHNTLDRAFDVVNTLIPTALVECGDDHLRNSGWDPAIQSYQKLLDRYPGHELSARAQDGITQATQGKELANVRNLLSSQQYCSGPAKYSGAAPYGPGVNHTVFVGNDDYSNRLPADWRVDDPQNAVLVVCLADTEFGTPVDTCPYIDDAGITGDTTFHKVAIPAKAYELRTGNLVFDGRIEFGAGSCPSSFTAFSSFPDSGPPPDRYLDVTDDDVRAGFAPVITP